MKNISFFSLLVFLLTSFISFSQTNYSGFFLVNEKNEGIPLRELEKEEMVYVDSTAVIHLSEIEEMETVISQYQDDYLLRFQLNDLGTIKLQQISNNISIPAQRIALVLDNVILSNAYLNSEIPNGEFSLSGFDLMKANAVLNLIKKQKAKIIKN
ncbi:SecDF P1 head subdomain-containing protein [Maribacter vaceletii]|uniref:SecDF P1 head subdomain-containing protein n=1 Tax=Maribacter vaceletii TaxID=1206816 RepID=UPI000EAB5016|nr:hypothetical protein [Maribacter vaceletii]